MSYLFNNKVGFIGEAIDAFSRLKTSTPFTLFDSQNRYALNDKWDTQLTGNAGITFKPDESAVDITIGLTAGDRVIRETKRVFPYQPGKSLLVLNTFAFSGGKTNLRQRVGYFGTDNGIYLEQQDGILYFVLRSKTSGTVDSTTRRIPQSEWNGDTMDGTGASGRLLDATKANILWMDIEWLGVGNVRCGFFVDGRPVVAHTFHNDNLNTTTYMTTASLPLRFEMENLAGTTGSSTMKQICSSVMSEAGFEGFSRRFNISTGTTGPDLAAKDTYYPIISIRLPSDRLDGVIVPSNANIIVPSNTWVQYRLILNPTLNGGSWVKHPNGNVEYNIAATGFAGGTDIIGGYVQNGGIANITEASDFNFQLGRTIGGTSDVLTLVMASGSNNVSVLADFSWFEII